MRIVYPEEKEIKEAKRMDENEGKEGEWIRPGTPKQRRKRGLYIELFYQC